jgi:Uri superfamily endonuclease
MHRNRKLKGIYVLVIQLSKDTRLQVGALGVQFFQKGIYLYIGSAQNNLLQRVKRHLRKDKQKFWHIDYLLAVDLAIVTKVFYKVAEKTEECFYANQISKQGKPVVGFGGSDCYCKSHLYLVEDIKMLESNMQPLSVD